LPRRRLATACLSRRSTKALMPSLGFHSLRMALVRVGQRRRRRCGRSLCCRRSASCDNGGPAKARRSAMGWRLSGRGRRDRFVHADIDNECAAQAAGRASPETCRQERREIFKPVTDRRGCLAIATAQ
jgi:hypothetical protein